MSTGATAPWFLQQYFGADGKPLSGGKLYFFVAGSTIIPKNVYSDVALTIPLSQPLTLNASGTAPQYFMESGAYKVVVTSATGSIESPVATRDNIAGGDTSGAGASVGISAIESFPSSEINWITDPGADIFRTDGCFCWIIPANNIKTIKFFKTISAFNTTYATGKVSIWGDIAFDFSSAANLAEFNLPDVPTAGVHDLDLDVSSYRWIGVACDPGLMDSGVAIKQTGLVLPSSVPVLAPRFMGYVGQHTHNTTYSAFPPIYAVDTKYMMTRWMSLGVVYKETV